MDIQHLAELDSTQSWSHVTLGDALIFPWAKFLINGYLVGDL